MEKEVAVNPRAELRAQILSELPEAAPLPERDSAPAEATESVPQAAEQTESTEQAKTASPPSPPVEPVAKEPEADPVAAKRLEAIHRAEQRSKESLKREREAVAAERAELLKLSDQVKKYQEAIARAKYDPVAALEALGVEDLEHVARQAYLRSKTAAADPKAKEAALREAREREHRTELEKMRAEISAIKEERDRELRAAQEEQMVAAYLSQVTAAVDDSAPLVKRLIEKNPSKTKNQIQEIAWRMAQELGEAPEPADVVAALEKQRREDLEEAGIDVASMLKPKTEPVQASENKKAAKTLSNDLGTPTKPRAAPSSREDLLAEVAKQMPGFSD